MAEEKMDFRAEDKEILVKIVKLAQAYQIKGAKGDWKEFLRVRDGKLGSSLNDPSKRSWDVLADFVKTFTAEEDVELVIRLLKWNKRSKSWQSRMKRVLDKASPKQELVLLTFQHPKFSKCYTFPSYQKGWLTTKLGKLPEASGAETMIAIDCEMVQCEDGTKEVVKVCVVNENLETLVDSLVKPSKHVVDYMTSITGVTSEDLDDVTCSLQDIQKTLKRLLKKETILVGHSLFNDLQALRVDHARVIDTAFIFRYLNKPTCYSPSLSKLCKVVLGCDLREEGKSHVCLDDAIAAMRLTLAKLELGVNDPIDMGESEVSEADLSKLYIHNIPGCISMEDLMNLFPKEYSVEIQEFSRIKNKSSTTFAIFKSSEDANGAFEILNGILEKDSYGHPQKRVWFHKRGSKKGANINVRVRKMNVVDEEAPTSQLHGCSIDPIVTRNTSSDISNNISKYDTEETFHKQKKTKYDKNTNQENMMQNVLEKECNGCIHLEEKERLKKELEQRNAEIKSLQRIVAALTRKHGL
ncbi:small RNA degrading nuclease 1 isoform X2 [Cryptomeria japonica]|uniref:small RNA degrading nuclease 1 isoform X2 n=1 Tax=Cryptomeria japonica TaxID=3369 RepID=UPI0025ACB5F2|nr:small RNA degrading nuclease 1 isoform X2 [Cryptomeria japonica]